VITGNCNLKTFFDFSCYFVFIHIYLHFFSFSGEAFFILNKESKENRKVRNVCLVGNTDDSSILLEGDAAQNLMSIIQTYLIQN